MHKVISKSKTGMLQLVEVGQPDNQAKWYSLVEKCKSFADRTKIGDIVTISSKNENGSSLISFIKKESGATTSSKDSFNPPILDETTKHQDEHSSYNSGWSKQEKEKYGREEAERKNRQGTIGAVATIVASLGFTKDDSVDEIVRVMSDIYTKLSAKLNTISTANALPETSSLNKKEFFEPEGLTSKENLDELGDPISLDDDLMTDSPMQEVNLGDDDVPF